MFLFYCFPDRILCGFFNAPHAFQILHLFDLPPLITLVIFGENGSYEVLHYAASTRFLSLRSHYSPRFSQFLPSLSEIDKIPWQLFTVTKWMSYCNKNEGTPFRLIVCSLETVHDAVCSSDCLIFSVDMNGKKIGEYSLLNCNAVYFGENPTFFEGT